MFISETRSKTRNPYPITDMYVHGMLVKYVEMELVGSKLRHNQNICISINEINTIKHRANQIAF